MLVMSTLQSYLFELAICHHYIQEGNDIIFMLSIQQYVQMSNIIVLFINKFDRFNTFMISLTLLTTLYASLVANNIISPSRNCN